MFLTFTKMHGLGNDFVLLDSRDLPPLEEVSLSALTRRICDRHFGVGADGLIIAAPPSAPQFDVRFIYFNGDGKEAEMCGNGIRCFALFARKTGWVQQSSFTVETLAGAIVPTIHPDGTVTVDMGPPILELSAIPVDPSHYVTPGTLDVEGVSVPVHPVSMGNPHSIIFQEDLPTPLSPEVYGPAIEVHPAFPAKTNVEFVEVLDDETLRVRVWERGCGFTLACGTGACATVVASSMVGKTTRTCTVQLPGGNLSIDWQQGEVGHVLMTGPATTVFHGSFDVNFPLAEGPLREQTAMLSRQSSS